PFNVFLPQQYTKAGSSLAYHLIPKLQEKGTIQWHQNWFNEWSMFIRSFSLNCRKRVKGGRRNQSSMTQICHKPL
ncbi:unnamed protein product, partial [Linum tenue]